MHQKSPPQTVSKPRRSTFEKSAPQTVSKRIKISPKTVSKFFCRCRDSRQTACPSEHRIAHIPRPPGVRSRKIPWRVPNCTTNTQGMEGGQPGVPKGSHPNPPRSSQSRPQAGLPAFPSWDYWLASSGLGVGKKDRWGCRVWSRSKLRSRYYT